MIKVRILDTEESLIDDDNLEFETYKPIKASSVEKTEPRKTIRERRGNKTKAFEQNDIIEINNELPF